MPQVVFNNGRSASDTDWSVLNSNALIEGQRRNNLKEDRFNLALNKAVNLVRKSNAPIGAKITLEDGQTKSNQILENHIANRNDPKSRAQQVALQATLARTGADKQKENLNMVDLAQGQKPTGGGMSENQQEVVGNAGDLSNKDLLSVPGAVVDKSTGAVTPLDSATNTVKEMFNNLKGDSKGVSGGSNNGFNTNLSIGGASVSGAQDNVFVNANAQTRVDDSVGYNTNQAMWQAMLDDVGRTYAGDTQFDPSKELAFSRAQLLDQTINEMNSRDTQLAAGMSRYEQGAAGGVKLGDVSVGMGESAGQNLSINNSSRNTADMGSGKQAPLKRKSFRFNTFGNKTLSTNNIVPDQDNVNRFSLPISETINGVHHKFPTHFDFESAGEQLQNDINKYTKSMKLNSISSADVLRAIKKGKSGGVTRDKALQIYAETLTTQRTPYMGHKYKIGPNGNSLEMIDPNGNVSYYADATQEGFMVYPVNGRTVEDLRYVGANADYDEANASSEKQADISGGGIGG